MNQESRNHKDTIKATGELWKAILWPHPGVREKSFGGVGSLAEVTFFSASAVPHRKEEEEGEEEKEEQEEEYEEEEDR